MAPATKPGRIASSTPSGADLHVLVDRQPAGVTGRTRGGQDVVGAWRLVLDGNGGLLKRPVAGDRPYRPVVAVLSLADQIGRDDARVGLAFGQDEAVRESSEHVDAETVSGRLLFIAVFGELARLPAPCSGLLCPHIAEFGAADEYGLVHPRRLGPGAVDALTPVQLREQLLRIVAETDLADDLPAIEAEETNSAGVGFRLLSGVSRTLQNSPGPTDPLRIEANRDTAWVNDADPALERSTPQATSSRWP